MKSYAPAIRWMVCVLASLFILSLSACKKEDIAASAGGNPFTPPDQAPCDSGFAIDSADPLEAAMAMGICLGLNSATWGQPDGSAPPVAQLAAYHLGHGLLGGFGPNVSVPEGALLLALSTGTARAEADPGYVNAYEKGYTHPEPAGFPLQPPFECAFYNYFHTTPATYSATANDGLELQVSVTAPAGAVGFTFQYKYYSSDLPDWLCSTFVDTAAVLMDPPPAGAPATGILLDFFGNPVTIDHPATAGVCNPTAFPAPANLGDLGDYLQTYFPCPYGYSDLVGTGYTFGGSWGGASVWQSVTIPVTANSTYTLRFMIWDSQDGLGDSTLLLDNWRWMF